MYYIGLDLGTSGLKGLLTDRDGNVLREATATYPLRFPEIGWSEQDPADWLCACETVLGELTSGISQEIAGVGISGQMHGLVLLDADDAVIRPAILWNDGRAQPQTDFLNETVGKDALAEQTANIAYAGFTAPKLLWVRKHEPKNFARIAKICLPKDYLTYMLTGAFATDYSDASGTLLLDVKNKRWSDEMCAICSVQKSWLPRLYESHAVVGRVKPRFRLPHASVTAGAGDNAAAAVGTGTVRGGDCTVSLGTSGTVFIAGDAFTADLSHALHAFCHANGRWHLMGCMLSAASANKWWVEDILGASDYAAAVQGVERLRGRNSVFFLPYLMGERSPHNDADARGAFVGMRLDTTKEQMSLAVLEGVAFGLRDCVEAARADGIDVRSVRLCGGGAKSALWKQIIADVLNVEVCVPEIEQGPAYGAAILAMVGVGEYDDVNAAATRIVRTKARIRPDRTVVEQYEKKYAVYKELYPALRKSFARMKQEETKTC